MIECLCVNPGPDHQATYPTNPINVSSIHPCLSHHPHKCIFACTYFRALRINSFSKKKPIKFFSADKTAEISKIFSPEIVSDKSDNFFSGDPYTVRNVKCVAVEKNIISVQYHSHGGTYTQIKEFVNHTLCEMR